MSHRFETAHYKLIEKRQLQLRIFLSVHIGLSETLCKMQHGEGHPPGLTRSGARPGFSNSPEENWAPRPGEPKIFAELMQTKSTRRILELVHHSQWLRTNRLLETFLVTRPECCLQIKRDPRFPKRPDKQREFLAESIAAVYAGYQPSRGTRYLRDKIRQTTDSDFFDPLLRRLRETPKFNMPARSASDHPTANRRGAT